jgi:hypothetical protein
MSGGWKYDVTAAWPRKSSPGGAGEVGRRQAAELDVGEQVGADPVQRVRKVGGDVARGGVAAGRARHEERRHVRGIAEQDHVGRVDQAVRVRQPVADEALDLRVGRADLAGAGAHLAHAREVALGLALCAEGVGRGTQLRVGYDQQLLAAEADRRVVAQVVDDRLEVQQRVVVVAERVVPSVVDRLRRERPLVVAAEVHGHVDRREHLERLRLRLVLARAGAHAAHEDVAHRAERAAVDRLGRERLVRLVGLRVDLERRLEEGVDRRDRRRRVDGRGLLVDRLRLVGVEIHAPERVAVGALRVDVHRGSIRDREEARQRGQPRPTVAGPEACALHLELDEVLAADLMGDEVGRR